jgi:hypothetical protein
VSWIDTGPWDQTRGRELVRLLSDVYRLQAEMQALMDNAQVPAELTPQPMRLGLMWGELLRTLLGRRMLRGFLRVVAADRPALAPGIAALDVDDSAGGNPVDPFEVRLLPPGRRTLINRADLRIYLRRFIEEPWPVLIVRGPPRCGKSYSYQLMQHVVGDHDDWRLVKIDFSRPSSGSTAVELMAMLKRRLNLNVPDRTSMTTATKFADELVDDLIGAYHVDDRITRILVIDGLNRDDLTKDVHDFAARLAAEVADKQLPRTKLVLTGYAGSLDPGLAHVVLTEDVAGITDSHIRLFFSELNGGLSRPELDRLVAEVMDGAPGIEVVGDRVRTLALSMIGGS